MAERLAEFSGQETSDHLSFAVDSRRWIYVDNDLSRVSIDSFGSNHLISWSSDISLLDFLTVSERFVEMRGKHLLPHYVKYGKAVRDSSYHKNLSDLRRNILAKDKRADFIRIGDISPVEAINWCRKSPFLDNPNGQGEVNIIVSDHSKEFNSTWLAGFMIATSTLAIKNDVRAQVDEILEFI